MTLFQIYSEAAYKFPEVLYKQPQNKISMQLPFLQNSLRPKAIGLFTVPLFYLSFSGLQSSSQFHGQQQPHSEDQCPQTPTSLDDLQE